MAANESQVPVLEIAHVLFMDIVSYSKLPMDEQQKVLRQLQHAVRDTPEFQRAQDADQLIRLPTGDGMALVFFGDPEAPARCALELGRELRERMDIKLRMGIHSGPVYRLADINANRNVSGGGINLAQRVMDCGDANHILVSAAVAEVLNEIGNWGHALHDIGDAEVKHGVRIHVFNLFTPEVGNPDLPQRLQNRPVSQPGKAAAVANAPLDSLIGITVSHYRVLRRVDGGGMGIVYEAVDTRLGRHVALKFLSEHLLQDALALERFRREATLASALNHPNICTLYDIGEHEGRSFLVLELLDGETLQTSMERGGLQLHDVLEWAVQVADALQMAHSRDIVHRDIKPGNIFITDLGAAKILDFGLAKLSAGQSSRQSAACAEAKLTVAGVPLGTVAYMSPEQARGEELDARSDIFSFGAVLYEMATGRLPFQGNTSAVVFDAILNRAPTAPITLKRELPLRLQEIINRAIEKDRARRYQSAGSIATELRQLLRELDSATPARQPAPTASVLRPSIMIAAVVAASGIVVGGLWFMRTHRLASVAKPSNDQQRQAINASPSDRAAVPQPAHSSGSDVKAAEAQHSPAIRPRSKTLMETAATPITKPPTASARTTVVSGEYSGNLHLGSSNTDAPATARLIEQAGIVSGCLGLSPPLRGSGSIRGVSHGDLVLVTAYFSSGRTELQGQLVGEELRGKYLITDGGRRQEGTFALQRKSSSEQLAVAGANACRTD